YRTTPKAYVTLAEARKLWGSRFGDTTGVRFEEPRTGDPNLGEKAPKLEDAADVRSKLLKELDPKAAGFTFDAVRQRLLNASRGGTDFGGLFLGFSSFLIAAALILVGLLVRLNLDRRASEIGLLLATGIDIRRVRRLL